MKAIGRRLSLNRAFLLHRTCFRTMAAMSSAGSPDLHPRARAVLDYWLGEEWATAGKGYLPAEKAKLWFKGGPEVDKEITERFGADCEALAAGKYDDWQGAPYNCLAGIIVGDQLTRNVYRGSAAMFQNDGRALAWARALVGSGNYTSLKPVERVWVAMPFMHSEELADQQECIRLFEELGQECERAEGCEGMARMAKENVKYAVLHRDIIAKWGRFPHRNAVLGRASTPEEAAGLADGSILAF